VPPAGEAERTQHQLSVLTWIGELGVWVASKVVVPGPDALNERDGGVEHLLQPDIIIVKLSVRLTA